MNLKNLKIGTQLLIGFTLIVGLMLLMGIFAFSKIKQLQMQTEFMYDHPYQVQLALKRLDIANLNMRLNIRDLLLAASEDSINNAQERLELSTLEIDNQLSIIESQYLGPKSDVEDLIKSITIWRLKYNENIKIALAGNKDLAYQNIEANGEVGLKRDIMLADLSRIDAFANAKANELYNEATSLSRLAIFQLIVIICTIFILSLIIALVVQKNINFPLLEMNQTVKRFHNGAFSIRSQYAFKNEFGELSESINKLADRIQVNMTLNQKTSELSDIMLADSVPAIFFNKTLTKLSLHTGAQMAAIYVLDKSEQIYNLYASIGHDNFVKPSFNALTHEGIFGTTIESNKIQHIMAIPSEQSIDFQAVHGTIKAKEILTIPIGSTEGTFAIISLSTINHFEEDAVQYLDAVIKTLATRIEGVLAQNVINNFKNELEAQNRDLMQHKTELSAQTFELTQQNIELEMQKKQLDASSQLKTHFLSNMSHELRTPLNSVIALSSVLSRRLNNKIPDEEYSYLEIIERNGKNLLALINDILDISRIEAGKEEVFLSKFDVSELIENIVIQIKPQADQNLVDLIHIKSVYPLFLKSDSVKFQHILQNLIGNAVKFTLEGRVEVQADKIDDQLIIVVKDTGIGIAEEYISDIFDEFRQGDGSTSRRFHGTGLGLAIAKKYASLLGGTISVKSVKDIGSEFTLILPLEYCGTDLEPFEDTFDNEKRKDEAQSEIVNKRNNTILLVEDNESAVIQIKDLVEEMGFNVVVASNGKVALKIIEIIIPDAIIMDLMMPEVDGFQLLETVRNADRTSHVPVLILTAKHITKEELKFLKRNNIHQLIQKGDIDRTRLQIAISAMRMTNNIDTKEIIPEIREMPVILVVEDNSDNMITVKAMLSDKYFVLEAFDAISGINIAKEKIPNLILMDIALPGMSGIDAFKEIRKMPSLEHIPIIALTASAMLHDRETILAHGFDAFISKPIIENQFYNVINEVLYGS